MNTEEFDIVIVGAGMVGATLACALAQQTSYTIALVDAGSTPNIQQGELFDSRVVALSRASQAMLQNISAWSEIQQLRACPYYKMLVWDAEGTGKVEFDCRDSHQPNLGYIVENSVVVSALHKIIKSLPNIDVFQNADLCEAEQGMVTVRRKADSLSLRCQLLIAADGARSLLREKMSVDTREWDYGQTAIVCTVKTDEPHRFACWQRFTQRGPVALLPLCREPGAVTGDEFYSSLVWSVDTADSDMLMSLDDVGFSQVLTRDLESALGAIVSVSPRDAFPLRQRHAVDYVKPGFALVGDAAHTIHPLAGQGVNLGFADVLALVEEIARAERRCVPLSHFSILQRYQRQRKAPNLATMATMEGFKRLFGSDDITVRWLRNTGMHVFNRQRWLKNQLAKIAAGD